MFGFRKKNIDGVVTVEIPNFKKQLEDVVNEKTAFLKNLVECEKCGCLLNKKTAFRGEPKKVIIPQNPMYKLGVSISEFIGTVNEIDTGDKNEYELKEVYFCKIHKPNKK